METSTARAEDVLGVSRSGRVRKKSSKLLDSVLINELEKKPKRTPKPAGRSSGTGQGRGRPPSSTPKPRKLQMDGITTLKKTLRLAKSQDDLDSTVEDGGAEPEDDLFVSAVGANSDDELDELVAGIVEGVEAESIGNGGGVCGYNGGESKVRQSVYMTEKSNKRKMLKDGKVITGKLERKDKGKTRYTAYSLWAREFRKTPKFNKNQDLDFANAAKRLGELWANVSNKEKSTWRRKAKIQATKAKARDKIAPANTAIGAGTGSNAGFLNRATTSRTRKLAEQQQKSPVPTAGTNSVGGGGSSNSSSPMQTKRKRNNSHKTTSNSDVAVLSSNGVTDSPPTAHTPNSNSQTAQSTLSQPEIEAIDAAAHLKLLGESLTIIGESLKDHEGQIAPSGSLSVLLDSLLCSIGPLLCLTTHIPGLDKKPQLKDNLSATLDNIAYVMPGL